MVHDHACLHLWAVGVETPTAMDKVSETAFGVFSVDHHFSLSPKLVKKMSIPFMLVCDLTSSCDRNRLGARIEKILPTLGDLIER